MASPFDPEKEGWIVNDISRKAAIRSDWRVWPPVILLGVVALTLMFQVPFVAAIAGGVVGALITAVAVRIGQQRIAVRIAVTDNELLWIDRGGRLHRASLTSITNIKRIPGQAESIVWYLDPKGGRDGFGIGPKAAEALNEGLQRHYERERKA